jgi:acetone carboxylase gamma subunit
MFQFGPLSEVMLRIQHQHNDGSWSTLEQEETHDPASIDPEQEWQRGHVYVCPSCGERVRIDAPDGEPRPVSG